MGNLMKKQIVFKNLKFPKLKGTDPRKQIQGASEEINKNSSLKWHLDSTIPQENHYDLYEFKTKKNLQRSSFGVYEMPSSVSILTYNIWFEQSNKNNRYECILKLLQLSNADFICLQEVTQDFVYLLHSLPKQGWIKDYYTGVTPMQWYDTLILSKYKCKFFKTPFKNSFMSRSATFAELMTKDGQNLIIGSMHYESLDGNEKIREQQIFQVQQSTYKCSRVIIAGDYNFSDNYEENKIISKQYTDIWVHIHKSGEDRYTMPQTPKFAPWRPDHVLCKVPKSVSLQKAEIQKIGQFSIPPFEHEDYLKIGADNIVRTPSDHFGLVSWIPLI